MALELSVSSPCPRKWEELSGDNRVRYCGQCRLQVYNLTVLSPVQIEQLLQKTGGRLCGQLYVRKDRTATVRDCPEGRSSILRRRVGMLASGLLIVILGLACRSLVRPDLSGWPRWVQAVAEWIDPPQFRLYRTMGRMTCPPPTPAPAPSSVPPATNGG
jgi:hypothetical protein